MWEVWTYFHPLISWESLSRLTKVSGFPSEHLLTVALQLSWVPNEIIMPVGGKVAESDGQYGVRVESCGKWWLVWC